MVAHQDILDKKIEALRHRWRKLILLRGGSKVLLFTAAAFLIGVGLDSFFELNDIVRFALLAAIILLFFVSTFFFLVRPLMRLPTTTQFARYLEEKHPQLEDRLVTAVEVGGSEDAKTSPWFIEKLMDDAQLHIEPINLRKSINSKAALLWSSSALAMGLLLAAFLFSNFDFFSHKTNRIFTPWKFPTVKPKAVLTVSPGNTRVKKGSHQEIKAELAGFETSEVALYYSTDDSSWIKIEMDETLDAGVFVYNFFDITTQTKYYVKANEKLSDIYTFTVYKAPEIKRIDLGFKYPKYTGLKPKNELDSGDVWAPEGTLITINAVADKPLVEAKVVLGENKKLETTISRDTVVTASFRVSGDGFYKIKITDKDNLTNEPPPEYFVHSIPDQPPALTLQAPGRDVKASMVEEVPVKIGLQDDYGRPIVKLRYIVNDGDEQTVALKLNRTSPRSEDDLNPVQKFISDYMFYLEDLNVIPGDFLTYYFEATDQATATSKKPTTSEIYFILVRPFEQEFYRALSQGGGGSMPQGSRLSETQKSIIIATQKLLQKKESLEKGDFESNLEAITVSQKNLMEVTESMVFQIQQRSLLSGGGEEEKITQYYSAAAEAMQEAVDALEKSLLKTALVPERRSLRDLRRAEALIKEVQLQRAQGQGAGQAASMEELAQLFEDELDNLKNKYETIDQNERQKNDEEIDEALKKVKELAKRQEQFNQQMRDLARKSEEEKKRHIEELRRKQEELKRETQELTRNLQRMRQHNSNLPREILQNLQQATSEMNNITNNLKKENTDVAAAKGTRALNNLNRLQDLLQQSQKKSLRERLEGLQQKFQSIADSQKELKEDIQNLSSRSESDPDDELQKAKEKQARIKNDFSEAEKQLKNLLNQSRQNQRQTARATQELNKEINRSRIVQKMEAAQKLLEQKKLSSALNAEKDILNSLERVTDKLTGVRSALAETDEEKLDIVLNQTRRLRDNLEFIQNRSREELQRKNDGKAQNRQAGAGEVATSQEQLDPQQLNWLNEGLQRSLSELEMLRQGVKTDPNLTQELNKIGENLRNITRTFRGGVQNRIELIESQVLDLLRSFEVEIAQKLEILKSKEKLFLARDEKIPSEFQKLVEKYYEELSKTK